MRNNNNATSDGKVSECETGRQPSSDRSGSRPADVNVEEVVLAPKIHDLQCPQSIVGMGINTSSEPMGGF